MTIIYIIFTLNNAFGTLPSDCLFSPSSKLAMIMLAESTCVGNAPACELTEVWSHSGRK